ncbi:transposase [Candidatus Saccharibacteria bacterium]|nr:transposase [Candidatus Saccharibacteria bacterium]
MYPLRSNPKVDTRLDKQEVSRTIESYLDFYNNERPHMSLGFMTPAEFLLQYSQRNSKVQNVVS